MISHTVVGVSHFEKAFAFYDAVLGSLGLVLKFSEPERPWAGWMQPTVPRPLFLIGRPFDQAPPSPGNGQMVALLAPSRAAVDHAYALAISLGAQDEGAPGLRPHYHPDYYGAYFRDLDGNKLCICCHEPPDTPCAT